MRITLSIDTKNPAFPKDSLTIVQNELNRRVSKKLPGAEAVVKSSSISDLKCDDMKEAQQKIARALVEEMFEEADQWLVTDIWRH
ncbi:DinI-like family protein [Serratia sp. UGAL515B_01]|uniref:DinI-like family protein n=1 Tax=Serratia sp. UGAL515B_01 TaxID=2986763 RepID=UPI0029534572|nr:DinI-like family protein [Serratia sp. UGAL515B_01]WON77849.1 DinI family protein [Serratia sp. UGAL515B_01]